MMKCECHKGQEMTTKEALKIVLDKVGKMSREQLNKIMDHLESTQVKSYLNTSCVYVKNLAEYLEGKRLDDEFNEDLYEKVHQYYWNKKGEQ